MTKETLEMEIINHNAAGIDVGSRSHWVAVGQNEEQIKEFGVFNEDLFALADWLNEENIKTVAMESTGTYWQNLYAVLSARGFGVILCNGKFTKNIKGKKTDIKDCQWIQKLHSLGLLTSSFLPDEQTEQLRTYYRHRCNLVNTAASTSKKMQKYLRLLNIRLDVVVKDVCGLTGLKIIREICKGETNPNKLAKLRHYNCKKSEKEIAKALHSNGRKDFLFALKQELETYDYIQNKIEQCDKEIARILDQIIDGDENKKQHYIEKKPYKRINKNTPKNIDLNLKAYQMFEGVDLLAIEGMSYSTVLALMSKIGIDGIKQFPSAKHFSSWLRLAPNNKISGGKVLSSKVPKVATDLKLLLEMLQMLLETLKTQLL